MPRIKLIQCGCGVSIECHSSVNVCLGCGREYDSDGRSIKDVPHDGGTGWFKDDDPSDPDSIQTSEDAD